MTQKNLITLITLLICCIGLGACKEKGKDNEPPVEVQLRIPESVELQVGDTHQLDVKVSPKETKVSKYLLMKNLWDLWLPDKQPIKL